MARSSSGSVRFRGDTWYARITIASNDRVAYAMRWCATEGDAKARLAIVADIAARLRDSGHDRELVGRFVERAAERNGKALADVLEAVARVCAGNVSVPRRIGTTFQEFAEDWTSGRLNSRWPDHVKL